jgi:cytoskeletal protein CcmA (bactofilin family)
MWNKEKNSKIHRYDTLISSQTEIKGEIHFSGGLHIDGKVCGCVVAEPDAKAVVRISDQALIEGDIRAPHVIINGRVDGDVFCSEHVELAANAIVNGTVHYKLIEMLLGAQVNGNLVQHASSVAVEEDLVGSCVKTAVHSVSNG